MEENNIKHSKSINKIIVGIIIAVLAVGIIAGIFIIGFGNKKEPEVEKPILPCGMEFGFSRTEVVEIIPDMKYSVEAGTMDKVDQNFTHLSSLEKSVFEEFYGLKNALSDDLAVALSFNSDEKLYEYSFSLIIREGDNLKAEDIIDYYAEWFDQDYEFDNEESQVIEFEEKKLLCEITYIPPIEGETIAATLSVSVTSNEYKPVYKEIPESIINEAYNNYYYNVDSFKINLIKLLNNCSDSYSATYDSYRNIRYNIPSKIRNKIEADDFEFSDYLSTAYYLSVNGTICENPEIPYLMTENQEIISFIVFFDSNNQVKGYYKVDECSELYTAAVLTIF